jgi:hypothetical protein
MRVGVVALRDTACVWHCQDRAASECVRTAHLVVHIEARAQRSVQRIHSSQVSVSRRSDDLDRASVESADLVCACPIAIAFSLQPW